MREAEPERTVIQSTTGLLRHAAAARRVIGAAILNRQRPDRDRLQRHTGPKWTRLRSIPR
eukprot:scaffold395_cov243-Pinguiococcus_pyrenoidosus.AAC.31